MSTRRAYFSNGEIIEATCGKSAFKRHVALRMRYADEPTRVWFRDCDEWRTATKNSLDAWARKRGFVSYDAYNFLRRLVSKS